MVSNLARFLRLLRISKYEILYDMALKLNMKSSDLSKIENGYQNPPKDFADKIIKLYNLDEEQQLLLKFSISELYSINNKGED